MSWSLAHNRFSTRQGDDLGNGEALSLEWAHTLLFDGPAWQLRGGIDYQRNRLENRVPDDLLAAHGGALRSMARAARTCCRSAMARFTSAAPGAVASLAR